MLTNIFSCLPVVSGTFLFAYPMSMMSWTASGRVLSCRFFVAALANMAIHVCGHQAAAFPSRWHIKLIRSPLISLLKRDVPFMYLSGESYPSPTPPQPLHPFDVGLPPTFRTLLLTINPFVKMRRTFSKSKRFAPPVQ